MLVLAPLTPKFFLSSPLVLRFSVCHGAWDAHRYYPVAYGVEHLGRCLLEVVVGRLAVDGVNHYLARGDVPYGFEPRADVFLARVVNVVAVNRAAHEHRLHDGVPVERADCLDYFAHVVGGVSRSVHLV